MMLSPLRLGLISGVAVGLVATAALAQATNYTTVEATVGKPLQLGYHASAHKNNCTPAPLPAIKVLKAPKSGTLTVRRAELTTDKIPGCPKMKVPAQVAFYQARTGGTAMDHLAYEVTNDNGEVASYDFTINIKEAPAPLPAEEKDHKI